MAGAAWCVVIAKPAAEQVAAAEIMRRGYRSYLPMCRRILTGNRRGKGEVVLRPLFPRYLFAELHPQQPWSPMLYAIGVCDIIRDTAGSPAAIADSIINELRNRERAQEFDERHQSDQPTIVTPGDTVRFVCGPFAEMLGTVAKLSGKQRAEIFLEALGRTVSIDRRSLQIVA